MKKNSTLLMVGILGAVAILSAGLAVLPTTAIQQASAQGTDFSFEQEQKNRCSGNAECSNEGTITFGEPVMDALVSFPLDA
jgi:hypothetical protein